MKTLDRKQIDRLVRPLEGHAYALALQLNHDRETAVSTLCEAFGATANAFPRAADPGALQPLLEAAIKKALGRNGFEAGIANGIPPVSVPERLHDRLVDIVEERQNDEPLGRRKVFLGGVVVTLLVAAFAGFGVVRWSALAAARPVVAQTDPTANAREVAVQGDFWVSFKRAPSAKPRITVEPADASLEPAVWDGHTVLVSYSGLHLASSYTLTIAADYRSHYQDVGHFIERWRFTTEGYPVLLSINPPDGTTGAFRDGQFSVEFNHRPPVDPTITINPVGGSFDPGEWVGSTWNVGYAGLRPTTKYEATVFVDYGVAKADVKESWSFTTESGPPPRGVPVIWYFGGSRNFPPSSGPQRFVALNWNGDAVGTTYLTNPQRQTWDGSLVSGQAGTFYDANGSVIGSGAANAAVADDSQTLCELSDTNGSGGVLEQALFVGPVDGPLHRIALLNATPASYGLVGCSMSSNRAVLTQGQMNGISSLTVVSLRTGQVLYRHAYSALPTIITPARDARYIAEQTPTINGQGMVTAWVTVIRRLADGAIVARLPNENVLAFSWDDRRVVTEVAPGLGAEEIDLLDWQSGQVVWRLPVAQVPNSYSPAYATAEPNGSRVAVAVGTPSTNGDVNQLWIVSADGAAKLVLNSTFYSLFFYGY